MTTIDLTRHGLRRALAATALTLALGWSIAGAAPLVPVADDGGGGGSIALSEREMLRGDYSPLDAAPEVAGIRASGPSETEMLRGGYSPVDAAPEVAAIASAPATTSEMLRGTLSPLI